MLEPGDKLTKTTCGWCGGPISLIGIGTPQQELKYYRDLEFGKREFLPFCSADCALMEYEKNVLKREPPDWGPTAG